VFKVADLHCDTIRRVRSGADLSIRSKAGHVDIPRLREGGVALQFFAAFARPERRRRARYLDQTLATVHLIRKTIADHPNDLELVTTAGEARRADRRGRIGVVISVEGLHSLDGDIRWLRTFYDLGVRAFGVTWHNSNQLATSAYDETFGLPKGMEFGLTALGERAVRETERLGAMVDVSHIGERAFWRLIEMVKQPPIASHSLARQVYNHFRNLTDAQIRALALLGGVIGVNFCSGFITDRGCGTVEDVANHVERLAEIGGIGCAAVGSDFDGISRSPKGLEHVGRMQNLAAALSRRGFGDQQIERVMMGNFLRVFRQVCGS
jgi:membrane dipeptidase